jgi:hypothetical protein
MYLSLNWKNRHTFCSLGQKSLWGGSQTQARLRIGWGTRARAVMVTDSLPQPLSEGPVHLPLTQRLNSYCGTRGIVSSSRDSIVIQCDLALNRLIYQTQDKKKKWQSPCPKNSKNSKAAPAQNQARVGLPMWSHKASLALNPSAMLNVTIGPQRFPSVASCNPYNNTTVEATVD